MGSGELKKNFFEEKHLDIHYPVTVLPIQLQN